MYDHDEDEERCSVCGIQGCDGLTTCEQCGNDIACGRELCHSCAEQERIDNDPHAGDPRYDPFGL